MAQNKKKSSLEVAEANSVVVEIPKLVLAGEQVRDKLVNVNKMPTYRLNFRIPRHCSTTKNPATAVLKAIEFT